MAEFGGRCRKARLVVCDRSATTGNAVDLTCCHCTPTHSVAVAVSVSPPTTAKGCRHDCYPAKPKKKATNKQKRNTEHLYIYPSPRCTAVDKASPVSHGFVLWMSSVSIYSHVSTRLWARRSMKLTEQAMTPWAITGCNGRSGHGELRTIRTPWPELPASVGTCCCKVACANTHTHSHTHTHTHTHTYTHSHPPTHQPTHTHREMTTTTEYIHAVDLKTTPTQRRLNWRDNLSVDQVQPAGFSLNERLYLQRTSLAQC